MFPESDKSKIILKSMIPHHISTRIGSDIFLTGCGLLIIYNGYTVSGSFHAYLRLVWLRKVKECPAVVRNSKIKRENRPGPIFSLNIKMVFDFIYRSNIGLSFYRQQKNE